MMSKTEELYKIAVHEMTIFNKDYSHFNCQQTIFKFIHRILPSSDYKTYTNVNAQKSIENLKSKVSDYYIQYDYEYNKNSEDGWYVSQETITFYTIEFPVILTFICTYTGEPYQILIVQHNGEYIQICKNIEFVPPTIIKYFDYVTYSNGTFSPARLETKDMKIDLSMNYNDDLPHDKILEFINSKNSGLAILYGKPGCGKTSYIRHLIYNSNKSFVYLDQSLFAYICDASFIQFLLNNKDCIFILEDCETLLADRITTNNSRLATLLNISDGLLGDSLNIKFICTFNCELNKLDSAIKRKGRLKIQYEFKPLVPEKANALIASLGKEVKHDCTLAQIYNSEDNGAEEMKRNKIGF